jgi:hypothetical protein
MDGSCGDMNLQIRNLRYLEGIDYKLKSISRASQSALQFLQQQKPPNEVRVMIVPACAPPFATRLPVHPADRSP